MTSSWNYFIGLSLFLYKGFIKQPLFSLGTIYFLGLLMQWQRRLFFFCEFSLLGCLIKGAQTHIMERDAFMQSSIRSFSIPAYSCAVSWRLVPFSSGQWERGSLHTGHVASPSQCTSATTETCDVETHTHTSGQFVILWHHAWFLTTGRN